MGRFLVVLLLFVSLATGGVVYSRMQGVFLNRSARSAPESVELIAWRGAPDYVPGEQSIEFSMSGVFEDSMAAFERAKARGCQVIHLDLHRTSDGHLVVIHDDDIKRTTNEAGLVSALTLAELQTFELGDGGRIPTLEEALSRLGDQVRYQIELHEGDFFPVVPAQLLEMLARFKILNKVRISSQYPWILGRLESLEPAVDTILVIRSTSVSTWPRLDVETSWIDFFGIDGVQLPAEMISKSRTTRLHERGLLVLADSVEDSSTYEKVESAGVDAVLSHFTSFAEQPPMVPPHRLEEESGLGASYSQ